jgi:hypothetical protein
VLTAILVDKDRPIQHAGTLDRSSIVAANHADGGVGGTGPTDGYGVGDRVYNLEAFDHDVLTLVFKNHASISDDDVFGLFA